MKEKINRFFKLEERNTSLSQEIIAGIIMFFALIYVIPVNTSLLSQTGMSESAAFSINVLSMAIAMLIIGLITNRGLVTAPGAGMNSFFVYTMCAILGYTWQEALAITLASSLIFFVISISGLREKMVNAIPIDLKHAVSAALGLFLAFIGLNMGGVIVSEASTLVKLYDFSNPEVNPLVLLALFGILVILVLSLLPNKISKYAIVIAMFSTALLGFILGKVGINHMPSFNFSNELNFKETFFVSWLSLGILKNPKAYALIFSAVFVQLFDATGSFVAVGREVGIIDEEGKLVEGKKIMITDSATMLIANTLGSPSSVIIAESAIGARNGARTGISSIVVSLLLFATLIIYPLFSIFATIQVNGVDYAPITTLALVYVGIMLFNNVRHIDFSNIVIASSSFILIIMTVFTHSFVNGLGFGFITYIIMMVFSKKAKEVNWIIYLIATIFLINFVVDYLLLK